MKERETSIDGRSRNRFQSIFRDYSLLEALAPSISNLSPGDLKKKVGEKCVLLEKELGLVIDPNHREEVALTLEHGNQVGAILIEVGCFPLLDNRQELILTRRIANGKKAIFYLKQCSFRTRDHEESVEATLDGVAARQLLICCNLRLVINISKKYNRQGVPFVDLIQTGNVRLIQAVESFEPDSGNAFSTYATYAIDRELQSEIAKNGYLARVPKYLAGEVRKIYGARDGLLQELKREPTDEEIAKTLHINPEIVTKLLIICQPPLSLDKPSLKSFKQDEIVETLYYWVKDEGPPTTEETEEEIDREILRERVGKIIASLPNPRERQVLEMNFALNGYRKHDLVEIGRTLGVTGERVRQLKEQALERLRQPPFQRLLEALL